MYFRCPLCLVFQLKKVRSPIKSLVRVNSMIINKSSYKNLLRLHSTVCRLSFVFYVIMQHVTLELLTWKKSATGCVSKMSAVMKGTQRFDISLVLVIAWLDGMIACSPPQFWWQTWRRSSIRDESEPWCYFKCKFNHFGPENPRGFVLPEAGIPASLVWGIVICKSVDERVLCPQATEKGFISKPSFHTNEFVASSSV